MIQLKVNQQQLQLLAKQLAKTIKIGDVFLLHGDLGAGKTTFVQMILAERGIKQPVTSPTFVIMKKYTGDMNYYHVDAYRLAGSEYLGFADYLEDGAFFIEWPENLLPFYHTNFTHINLEFVDEHTRLITIGDKQCI